MTFLCVAQALALGGMMWKHMSRKRDVPQLSWGMDGASRRRLSKSGHQDDTAPGVSSADAASASASGAKKGGGVAFQRTSETRKHLCV